jgi:hypothetical protein
MMNTAVPVADIKVGLNLMFRETFARNGVFGIYLDKGTTLFDTLAEVDAETASRPGRGRCATLAAHVEHMRFYLDTIEGYMNQTLDGQPDWDHIWNTVSAVTPDEWTAMQARLHASYERVSAVFQAMETMDGEQHLGAAMAMLLHSAYHLGEIRQMLCWLRAD